jgi:hypothetical protein
MLFLFALIEVADQFCLFVLFLFVFCSFVPPLFALFLLLDQNCKTPVLVVSNIVIMFDIVVSNIVTVILFDQNCC